MSYQSDTNIKTIDDTNDAVKGDSYGPATMPKIFLGEWYLIGHMSMA
jgi:hypothetical protein